MKKSLQGTSGRELIFKKMKYQKHAIRTEHVV